MSKLTSNMAIIMMAFFIISCGKQDEATENNDNTRINQSIRTSDIKDITSDEQKFIKQACEALNYKEVNFRTNFADRDKYFYFSNQEKACGQSTASSSNTQARVSYSNGNMSFIKVSGANLLHSEIILRTTEPMKSFCDLALSDGLTKRFITQSTMLQAIYSREYRGDIQIVINTGFDFRNDRLYTLKQKDEFIIKRSSDLANGVVIKRLKENSMACTGNQSQTTYTELKEIKF